METVGPRADGVPICDYVGTAPAVDPRTGEILICDIRTCGLTLSQFMGLFADAVERYPDHEVILDGDRYAVLARPRGCAS